IFLVTVATRKLRQLTNGNYYEHSIDWSPRGDEIVFVSNREPDPDRVFNYDVFAVKPADGSIRRLTQTRSAEYRPVWSPDGQSIVYLATKRPLTSSETTMEDTHVWSMDAKGSDRRELGGGIDNRQGLPQWSPDGRWIYFTVQERGNVRLYRLAAEGGRPEAVAPPLDQPGTIGSWSIAKGNLIAYALSTPATHSELYLKKDRTAPRALTSLNAELLSERRIGGVEALTFKSFDGTEVEAFLTRPPDVAPGSKHPLIVLIHGGPHGQQGPAFNT